VVIGLINNDTNPVRVSIPIDNALPPVKNWRDLLHGSSAEIIAGVLTGIKLSPRTGCILVPEVS
jgi:hypothetical protein